ncbi:BTAD domain-containing putative transcriptional regulator [uncultured Jatrophihabitans sp.]|uniref:BTAD domain-containing putative transcriptional regulator n=1 Tax=uncultured Jatrophihabitans sp. TaxID=1610747 RepID=UPI0035CC90B6
MQIALLGPLQVHDSSGRAVEIAGTRLRTLLIRLALDAGRPVSTRALVDAVWGDRPPADEANALQTLVSRLRRSLGDPSAIAASPAGYRLVADPEDVDALRFERQAVEGAAALRRGDHGSATPLLAAALDLWRSPSLVEVVGDCGEAVLGRAARLDDLRLEAEVDYAETTGATDVAGLTALAAAHPLNERLTGLLMRALGASGQQAEALRIYDQLRTRLADELGVDPSAEVQQVHLALVRGELEPAPAPAVRRTNLKAQLTSFIGREDEVARIAKSLEQNRLVTLVGPGGAGKTRLAAETAASIVDRAPDGVWLAELAGVTSGADVPQAVLSGVGLREIHLMDRGATVTARDAMSRLREGLAERNAILILDNCEHVIEAAAQLAEQLLGDCPSLRVIATSREPLGIIGETLLAVPALGQPAATAGAAEALEYPAVRLFADRAAAVAPDFAVDDTTVAAVIEVVRRLDGLPLAIELAAARLRTLPIDEIFGRLSDRFRLLTGGSRTALPRHRTLRAVVEWSWELLTLPERHLAELLAVFPAGITTASATAVRPDDVDAEEVPDLIASLVDKSLLQPVGDGRRTRMLETLREYGVERLVERGELAAARERHSEYFAALLDEASPHLTTAGQLPWFATLGLERENILAAMRLRCDLGDADVARRMAVQLSLFAMMLGDHGDVPSLVDEALAVPGGTDRGLELMARTLRTMNATAAGSSAQEVGEIERELQAIAREFDDVDTSTMTAMAVLRPAVAFFAQDRERMARFAAESLADGDVWAQAATHMFLANMAENDGDVDLMREQTLAALVQFREVGERWGLASTLRTLGAVHVLDGDLDAAVEAYEESLELVSELNSNDDKLFSYARLADIALRRGELQAARRYVELAQNCAEASGGIEAVFISAMLGDIEWRVGNEQHGRELHADGMRKLDELPREHPMRGHIRTFLLVLATRIALRDQDLTAAGRTAHEAYTAARGARDLPLLATAGVVAAEVEVARGHHESAAEVLGASARLRGADDETALDVSALTTVLRDELGDDPFERLYERGRALTSEEASARLEVPVE